MTLRLVADNEAEARLREARTITQDPSNGPGTVAPPRPTGTIPLELARLLQSNEPVIWWGEKNKLRWRPVAISAGVGLLLLMMVSAFAPELWSQPWREWLKPLVATQLPALFIFAREWFGRRRVLVTDKAIIDLDWRGRADRLGFRTVREVKRDWWSGGVRLVGQRHQVRVPPALMEDTRAAIASQTSMILDFGSEGPVDRLAWFPWPGR